MQHLLVLCALVAAASASGGYGVPLGGRLGPLQSSFGHGLAAPYGLAPYGLQGASLDYYSVPDYSTAYSVQDAYSGVDNHVQETRLGDRTEGSYSTVLPDGRRQIVTYWVDGDSGYNARVTYEGVAHYPQTPSYGAGRAGLGAGASSFGLASGGRGYGRGIATAGGLGYGRGVAGAAFTQPAVLGLGSSHSATGLRGGSGVVYRGGATARGYGAH